VNPASSPGRALRTAAGPVAGGLALACLLLAACRTDSPVPSPERPMPAPAPSHTLHPGTGSSGPRVRLDGREWPVTVIKTNRAREEFTVLPAGEPARAVDTWRSPVDRLFGAPPSAAVLFAYPTARPRALALRDSLRRTVVVVFLDGRARIGAHREVRLDGERRVLDPGGPVRFVLFLRGDAIEAGDLVAGGQAELPSEAWQGVEPEYFPIAEPPPADVRVGGAVVRAEVADTPSKRQRGFMYRDRVPDGTGMLFLYAEDDVLSFWMLNTRVPLDVAYIDRYGVIRRICPLEPNVLRGASSEIPVRMALECPAGWFARHGVRAGDRIELPERLGCRFEAEEDRDP
jgi:uncharacterized membrane protein (UPF0127 family)